MHSAVYVGSVRHRRRTPAANEFRYGIYLLYLDLDELPRVFRRRWLWSARRPNLAWFRRADYFGDPQQPLADAVRDRVEAETGYRPTGPIRVLTQMRTFGYVFNPVSFYYCFDESGRHVETILVEITNTPWKERHSYVLRTPDRKPADRLRFAFQKAFHVSPFMPMELDYDWRFTEPGAQLGVHMENLGAEGRFFDATLTLRRRPLDGRTLARLLVTHPFQTLKVPLAIHWQALKLWWKGVPFHAHPAKRARALEESVDEAA